MYPEDSSVLQAEPALPDSIVGQHPQIGPDSMEGAGLIPAIR